VCQCGKERSNREVRNKLMDILEKREIMGKNKMVFGNI
jgi:hypothetical protein